MHKEQKAFHPMTMGVMHWGFIVKYYPQYKSVKFYFWIDKKTYMIPENHVMT
jgi:hypothetical protein